ncbi:MAG: hypothetical protein JWQ88_925 [Rhodoferax sp.]|nr:hypothetical protein [Rhodoferax sp.]
METNQTNSSSGQPGLADHMQRNKMLVAIVAVLGVTVLALTAALVGNRTEANVGVPTAAPGLYAPVANAANASNAANAPSLAPQTLAPVTAPMQAPVQAPVARAPAPQPVNQYASNNTTYVQPKAPATVARNDVCSTCGTVESVQAVQRPGKVNGVNVGNTTIGIGTVAGGVLGGLLGHQVGGGNGKTAMSVLGAAGGAYAGNTVEKNMNKVTVYQVRVRMDNGTHRSMDISSDVPVGSRVIVEGKNLRLANGNG